MIDPKEEDIGRAVVYRPSVGRLEQGYITSFNDYCVFVRYGGVTSAATFREDLEWIDVPKPTAA